MVGANAVFTPKRLCVFALEPITGRPLSGAPFYAEVVAPTPFPDPPVNIDQRFEQVIAAQLLAIDNAAFNDPASRQRITDAIQQAIAKVLTSAARDRIVTDSALAAHFLGLIIKAAEQAHGGTLQTLVPPSLRPTVEKAVRDAATNLGFEVVPAATPDTAPKTAYPLGFLATDHVGYLSFDLERLPSEIYLSVLNAIEQRQTDINAVLDTSVWLYALGLESQRFDALAQGRFANDAVLTKLEITLPLKLPSVLRGIGFLSMQNPSLIDWRLSPTSFATTPLALLGNEDGCENLLPANVALHDYRFYQVLRFTDAVAPIPAELRQRLRLGVIQDFQTAWYPLGHSLGQILYSLPLAPGESVNLTVVDWTRRDEAQRKEVTTLDEQLVSDEHRDRGITETVNAAVQEYQHGSSLVGGIAASAGLSAAVSSSVGIAAGLAGSLGGSTASSNGTRTVAANTVQQVSDNISQFSSAQRELQSTVVVQSVQAEKEAIQTRTVVNYNHSHTLTILYYEVLRHYRVVTQRIALRPALLVRYDLIDFTTANIPCYRELLEPWLAAYKDGFDALDHLQVLTAQTPPAAPLAPLNWFYCHFTTGGWSPNSISSVSLYVTVFNHHLQPLAKFVRVIDDAGDIPAVGADTNNIIQFLQAPAVNTTYTFPALSDKAISPSDIHAIAFAFGVSKGSKDQIGIKEFSIDAIAADGTGYTNLFDWKGDLAYKDVGEGSWGWVTDLVQLPPAPDPYSGLSPDERSAMERLIAHLNCPEQKARFNRIIWLGEDPVHRALRFDGMAWDASSTLLDHIDNKPAEVLGQWVAFPSGDAALDHFIQKLETQDPRVSSSLPPIFDERLVTLPTRGIFADAKLGHCNASEEIDNTRFWDWQQSPIPHYAPDIAPATPVTPQPQQPNVTPTPFPQSLVNIVNPPNEPDPTGLAAALNVLATPNIFRDMSGQAQVADLLKRLSDNTIGIAEAANQARQIQAKYGSGAGSSLGSGVSTGPLGSPRAMPNQPSQTNRDLQDLQHVLGRAQDNNLISPEQAQAIYADATRQALGLQQVGDTYVRPAWTKNQLIGLVGEVLLSDALKRDGLIVFGDPTKHVAGNGIDLVALDPTAGEVWILDNKAQMGPIGGANALTGSNFDTYKDSVLDFLEKRSPHPRAIEAANLIRAGKFRKVIANAWAGLDTKFTQGVFTSALEVYDVRLGAKFTSYAAWESAFKAIPKGLSRLPGLRGSALLDGSMLVLAVYAAALFVASSDDKFKTLGQFAAETAMNAALCLLPGGFIASLTLGLESDNPAQMAANKRDETINQICAQVPGFFGMAKADQDQISNSIGQILDDPVLIPDPPAPPGPASQPRQILPGLTWPPAPEGPSA